MYVVVIGLSVTFNNLVADITVNGIIRYFNSNRLE